KINEIKLLGSKISIDDFGIENSNLDKFLDFYIDEVKFDRSILNSNYSIVRKLVMLLVATFNDHGIYTVAEGVDDKNTLTMIENMNFQCVQGFVFSRPINISQFGEYCSSRLLVCQ
ncbi:EAL domain-containing protein, partial [Vibrio sp. 10N.261.52.A1]